MTTPRPILAAAALALLLAACATDERMTFARDPEILRRAQEGRTRGDPAERPPEPPAPPATAVAEEAPPPAPKASPSPAAAAPAPAPAAKAPAKGMGAEAAGRLLAREGEGLTDREFSTPGGRRGTVAATSEPAIRPGDELEQIVFQVGAKTEMTCTFAPQRMDAGGALTKALEQVSKVAQVKSAQVSEIAQVEGRPVVFLEVLYFTGPDEARIFGLFKAAIHPNPNGGFFCEHDEVGYSKTFRRSVLRLARSLVRDGFVEGRPGGRTAELSVTLLGGRPVGFTEVQESEGEGGGTVVESFNFAALPRSPTELVLADGYDKEAFDDAGLLARGVYVRITGGELELQVLLARGADGRFKVQGKQSGKPIEGTFAAPQGLAGDRWFARRVLQAKPEAPVRHQAYAVGTNPLGPTDVTWRRLDGRKRAEVKQGGSVITGDLGGDGLLDNSTFEVGGATFQNDRVWTWTAP